jgi:catechol-2,3-dioxygenase
MSVENFRDTVDFYIGQIGFRPIVGSRDAEWCALSGTCGEISLALYRAGEDNPAGLHHIGLPLPDANELKMSVTRAKSLGLTVQEAGIGAERCSAFITDPNGILLQFYVAPPGAAGLADLSASRAISLV